VGLTNPSSLTGRAMTGVMMPTRRMARARRLLRSIVRKWSVVGGW